MADRPTPGSGYLALLIALLLGGIGTCVGVILSEDNATTQALLGAFFVAPITALTLLPLHAAFRTQYERTDQSLSLRAGIIIKAELPWAEIDEVIQVPFIPRVLGWGGGRGLANRFTNGVRIKTRRGAIYYASPTDPETFVEAALSAMGRE